MASAGMEFKDWSQAKFRTDPPISGTTKTDANFFIKENLDAVMKIRLGAEMLIPLVNARVRAGFFNVPSPYKDAEFMPDKEFLTAGASLMLDKQVMVDVGLVHGSWKQRSFEPLTQQKILEDISYDKIIGTLSIRF